MKMIYLSIAMIIFISQIALSQLDTVYSRHDYTKLRSIMQH